LVICLSLSICISGISPSQGEESLPAIVKRIEPSVVVILTYDKEGKPIGQGSGFFINQKGDVITNYHVLQGVREAKIRTADGNMYSVKAVVAEDKAGDLIRISVNLPEGNVLPLWVNASLPEAGERIAVIGTPLGLEKTVSDGIVAAVREIPGFGKIIQLTAPISLGSSGSPVVNMNGEVIGVATFFILAGQNLNFAIPSERIVRLTPGVGKSLPEWEKAEAKGEKIVAESFYLTGLRYLWIEEYEKALLYFMEAVKKNPRYAEAHFQIGYCKSKLGLYLEAIQSYNQAIQINPDDADIYNNLCVAYAKLGHYDESIETCKQAIWIKADLAEAYNNLSWSYHKVGRFQESIESCKQAIRLNPNLVMAHYNLGNNYFSLKKYEEAIESYKQTIRIKFDYAEGHLNLGAAYHRIGRYEEAIESYKQAIRLRPSLSEAHLNLGMAYLRVRDRGSALEEYKILKDLDKGLANQLFNLIYE